MILWKSRRTISCLRRKRSSSRKVIGMRMIQTKALNSAEMKDQNLKGLRRATEKTMCHHIGNRLFKELIQESETSSNTMFKTFKERSPATRSCPSKRSRMIHKRAKSPLLSKRSHNMSQKFQDCQLESRRYLHLSTNQPLLLEMNSKT